MPRVYHDLRTLKKLENFLYTMRYMNISKFRLWLTYTLLALLVFALLIQSITLHDEYISDGELVVAFLNVGQGDAVYIEAPNRVQVLIDSGPNSAVLKEVSSLVPFHDRTIDILIATHPDLDHIGGMPEILKRYEVGRYIFATSTKTTDATETVERLLEVEGAEIIHPRRGDRIILDPKENIYIDILFPDYLHTSSDANDQSVITRLVYGETEFLLTGDASKEVEEYLLEFEDDIQADVLKAGHHGSKTSSAEEFVRAVDPQYVVVSAGVDNRYGHPHKEVIDLFTTLGVEVESTKEGMVVFRSNGERVVNVK